MTVDRELVTRKLLLILRDLDVLAPVAAKERSAFLGSRFDQAVAERLLERMIGRMIDVKNEEIDPEKVFESLQAARNDIATYVRSVEAYVEHLSASQ